MAFSIKVPLIGLATLALGFAAPIESADAQFGGHGFRGGGGFHGGGFRGGGFRGGGFQGGGFRAGGFHPGWGGGVRPGWGGGIRPGFGYRPAVYARPAYGWGGYRPVNVWRPRYYGYRSPSYGYGYRYPSYGYGYPAYYGGYGYGYGYPGYGYYNDGGGAVVAGLIGGLAIGAIANAVNQPTYRRSYYRTASNCHDVRRRIVNRYGHVSHRWVQVCR